MLMIVLDLTVVNVALLVDPGRPRLLRASLAWVVNAYLIAFGGLLLLAGRLGDLLGRRRVFLAGLARVQPRLAGLRARAERDRRWSRPGSSRASAAR